MRRRPLRIKLVIANHSSAIRAAPEQDKGIIKGQEENNAIARLTSKRHAVPLSSETPGRCYGALLDVTGPAHQTPSDETVQP